jgi:pyruvate-ferredoxin/flavodoxin oxidoreductase
VAHLAAMKPAYPFLHFLTIPHSMKSKNRSSRKEELASMLRLDAVEAFSHRALNPDHPFVRGLRISMSFSAKEALIHLSMLTGYRSKKILDKINAFTERTTTSLLLWHLKQTPHCYHESGALSSMKPLILLRKGER